MRKSLGIAKADSVMSVEQFEERLLPVLMERQENGEISGTTRRGDRFLVQVEFADHEVEVAVDADGHALIDPPRRRVAVEAATDYEGFDPPSVPRHLHGASLGSSTRRETDSSRAGVRSISRR